MIYFAAIPPILLSASGDITFFLALSTGLVLLWRRWRAKRLARWSENALLW
jgi:membrane protein implicated in regulation of membrane protease activity